MVDFKGNELNIGDKVITISSWGDRILEEGIVVRMTPMKIEVKVGSYVPRLKSRWKVYKVA